MLKRENIKQAIDAISVMEPEIGYSLNEMLSTGQINVPSSSGETSQGDSLSFLFDNQKVLVNKYQYFSAGVVILEERLLIKFGELAKKHELLSTRDTLNYRQAALEIRQAGLRLLVTYEIDYALARLRRSLAEEGIGTGPRTGGSGPGKGAPRLTKKGRNNIEFYQELISFLEKIKDEDPALEIPWDEIDPAVLYQGVVGVDTPAYFVQFPFCLDALMQIAEINLEFFHVRFLLNCLARRMEKNLFVCVADRKILGAVYFVLKEEMFFKGLKIEYISTMRGGDSDRAETALPPVKGAGTFLMAGVWMLWKTWLPEVKDISLSSEIGASRFYESLGFRQRRLYEYVLKDPRGYLLKAILIMAGHCRAIKPEVVQEINDLIKKQVKLLSKKAKTKEEKSYRESVVAFMKLCLQSKARPEFVKTAVNALARHKKKIPESIELIQSAAENGLVPAKQKPAPGAQPLLVVNDERFTQHLDSIFHLENAKRVRVIDTVLHNPSIKGKWSEVAPRLASVEELAWVHTFEHIKRVARTAGQPLASFDLDTQTTEKSYEVARLAVGAVFNLLDEIWSGKADRGFAFIRPPGHHAEPDKAMGFCLFNNVALGARYLKERYSVQKVLVVDIDAHHGNGTQAAFYDTDEVLYFSLHEFPAYPGTGNLGEVGEGKGEGFTVNVPLSKGHGDKDFAQIIYFLLNPLAHQYQPEMILVSCGFDLCAYDRLSSMRGTPEGYALLTFLLLEIAEEVCHGRIAFIMEGGYSLMGIRECSLRLLQELCDVSTLSYDKTDKIKTGTPSKIASIKKVIEIQKKYWNL